MSQSVPDLWPLTLLSQSQDCVAKSSHMKSTIFTSPPPPTHERQYTDDVQVSPAASPPSRPVNVSQDNLQPSSCFHSLVCAAASLPPARWSSHQVQYPAKAATPWSEKCLHGSNLLKPSTLSMRALNLNSEPLCVFFFFFQTHFRDALKSLRLDKNLLAAGDTFCIFKKSFQVTSHFARHSVLHSRAASAEQQAVRCFSVCSWLLSLILFGSDASVASCCSHGGSSKSD